MNSFKITKGHNLKISGIPSKTLVDVFELLELEVYLLERPDDDCGE